jgi:hypothetical protein
MTVVELISKWLAQRCTAMQHHMKPSRSQVEVHNLNPWGGDMAIEAPKGTSMKPDAGLMFFHIGGYDGWFEKAVCCGRLDGRLPIKSATFTAFRGMHMVHGKC